ncbi:UrcA family protein [Sphingobium sp. OAS761]|uniref:UrcA family protein n=1 Tax=Sphingobium sp. OAS761 TaxID=2817901 RepID=UPI0020A11B50|nr:UrcA family protein [Sphingobium sp. OAS761]MCP1468683.1 UrcA family protein [Sphingobium sp. OAS761]
MFVSKSLSAVAAAALMMTAGVAAAQDFQSNGRTSEVHHGDLNLSKAADQKELRRRIASAASRVCASRDLAMAAACRSNAIAHVEAPVSAAIARAETGDRYADATPKEVRSAAGN